MNRAHVVPARNTRSVTASPGETELADMTRPHHSSFLGFVTVAVGIVALLVAGSGCAFAQEPPAISNEDRDRGIELLRAGRNSEALDALEKATRKNNLDEQAWYYLGVVCSRLKDYKKASSAFESATKVRPEFADAHTGFSSALMRQGRLAEARSEAEKAIAIDPKSKNAHYILGLIDFRTGATDEAIKHAEIAIEQNPAFAKAYLLKSQILMNSSGGAFSLRKDEANENRNEPYLALIDCLERYLQLTPDSADKEVWRDQIESLKYYATINSESEGHVFTGKDVTSKARVIAKPEPGYSQEARQSGVTGTIVLKAVFASDGTVKHILVIKGLTDGLTEQAVRSAQDIKFIPATVNGKPASMYMQLEYNFSLF